MCLPGAITLSLCSLSRNQTQRMQIGKGDSTCHPTLRYADCLKPRTIVARPSDKMTVQATNPSPTEASRLLSSPTPDDDARFERDGYGTAVADCESSSSSEPTVPETKTYSNSHIAKVVAALLIGKYSSMANAISISFPTGVFTSSTDASLVLATHPVIASEFGDLEDSSWLFISFMLAGAATQSLVGDMFLVV